MNKWLKGWDFLSFSGQADQSLQRLLEGRGDIVCTAWEKPRGMGTPGPS